MAFTKNQKVNERLAKLCDSIARSNSDGGRKYRRNNRIVENRKRKQFRNLYKNN
jgi:hypothetical protein